MPRKDICQMKRPQTIENKEIYFNKFREQVLQEDLKETKKSSYAGQI